MYVWIWQESRRALEERVQGQNLDLPPAQDGIRPHNRAPFGDVCCRFEGLETGAFVYDYFYDMEKGEWIPWMQTIPTFDIPRGARYEELVVPSVDSVRLVYAFQKLGEVLCAAWVKDSHHPRQARLVSWAYWHWQEREHLHVASETSA